MAARTVLRFLPDGGALPSANTLTSAAHSELQHAPEADVFGVAKTAVGGDWRRQDVLQVQTALGGWP